MHVTILSDDDELRDDTGVRAKAKKKTKTGSNTPTKPAPNPRADLAEAQAETWWLYLLACKDGRTYAGIALDVAARFALHVSGKGAKFTRANPPREILGAQAFTSRSEALKAEYALKQLDRAGRLKWAHHFKSSGTTKSL